MKWISALDSSCDTSPERLPVTTMIMSTPE
jgi:hypothetical protein